MNDTLDRFRSLVRSAARQLQTGLSRTTVGVMRARLLDLSKGRLTIADSVLTAELARIEHVQSVTTACGDGTIHVDATFDDGSSVTVGFRPSLVSFAPRGAKEISFDIEPLELVNDRRTADLAGMIASLIAKTIWSPMLTGAELTMPIVDREPGGVRIDLRSIPAVRAQLGQQVLGPLFEVLALGSIDVTRGALALTLKLYR